MVLSPAYLARTYFERLIRRHGLSVSPEYIQHVVDLSVRAARNEAVLLRRGRIAMNATIQKYIEAEVLELRYRLKSG